MQIKLMRYFFCVIMLLSSVYCAGTFIRPDYCCDDTEGELLPACAYSLQVHGGVVPWVWAGRGDECADLGDELPSPHTLFKVPFIVGGKIGFNWTDWIELYAEVDYVRAQGKDCLSLDIVCPASVTGTATITTALKHYSAVAAYGGSRFYFNVDWLRRFWHCHYFNNMSVFVGTKIGFVHHNTVGIAITSTTSAGVTATVCETMFCKANTISAGANFGIDYSINCDFDFVFTFEVVANGALRNNPVICLGTPLPGISATTAVVSGFNTEVWFPFTFGLKYTF